MPIFEALRDFEVVDPDGQRREIRKGSWWRIPGQRDEYIIAQAPDNFAVVFENEQEKSEWR